LLALVARPRPRARQVLEAARVLEVPRVLARPVAAAVARAAARVAGRRAAARRAAVICRTPATRADSSVEKGSCQKGRPRAAPFSSPRPLCTLAETARVHGRLYQVTGGVGSRSGFANR